jgi:VanZ family protein
MLCVTNHCHGDIAYEHTSFNRIVAVSVQTYQLSANAVRNAPTVNYQERVETTAFNNLHVTVYLCLGLSIALRVNDYGKTRFAVTARYQEQQTCCPQNAMI